jgi:hypothetical protein
VNPDGAKHPPGESDVLKAGLRHPLGERFGGQEVLGRGGQVIVRLGVTGNQAAEQWDYAMQVEVKEGAQRTGLRRGGVEGQDPTAAMEEAPLLGKNGLEVGDVAQEESRNDDIKCFAGKRQMHGIRDQPGEASASRASLTQREHLASEVGGNRAGQGSLAPRFQRQVTGAGA